MNISTDVVPPRDDALGHPEPTLASVLTNRCPAFLCGHVLYGEFVRCGGRFVELEGDARVPFYVHQRGCDCAPGGEIGWLKERIRKANEDASLGARIKAARIEADLARLPESEEARMLPEIETETLFRMWASISTAGTLFGAGVRLRDRLHAILKDRGRFRQ